MATIKKQYTLDGLCCGLCASKIEREIDSFDSVSSAGVDFVSQTLTVEHEEGGDILQMAQEVARTHDPKIVVREIQTAEAEHRTVYITGLKCAGCAVKIEAAIQELEGVESASLDVIGQKLELEVRDRSLMPGILRQAAKIADRIEPGVKFGYARVSDEPQKTFWQRYRYAAMLIGAVMFAVGLIAELGTVLEITVFLIAYVLIGGEVVVQAVRNILKGQVFDENFLMTLATGGAFAIGEFAEAVAVMLFYQVGEAFQERAVNNSRKSIAALMDVRPDYANLIDGDEVHVVAPEEIAVGDIILVRPGEKIPLDGVIIRGEGAVDTSALTGESLPRDVGPGEQVMSGSVSKSGLFTIGVEKEFGQSTISKVLELVMSASSKKAPTEKFITKFARYYTPAVVIAALALAVLPPLILPGEAFATWIQRALLFLVVSCPCALVISIPLGFFGGIGGASKNGILIKGGNYLEALSKVDVVVFDKTGTLTKGEFAIVETLPQSGYSAGELIRLAALVESYSSHPIAQSIVKAYDGEIDSSELEDYQELAGRGVKARYQNLSLAAGNLRLMQEESVVVKAAGGYGSHVYLAVDGICAGCIVVADEVKPDSAGTIGKLKQMGVRETIMLTGDGEQTGQAIGRSLGIDRVFAKLLPHEKVERLEEIMGKTRKGKVVYVGDGINDAPVLARADVGVAMGAMGSDAAIEAADVVLMTDEPSKLVSAISIARRTRAIVMQNIVFALVIKLIVMALGALGYASMWQAVFADVGVALIAILNSTRALRIKA